MRSGLCLLCGKVIGHLGRRTPANEVVKFKTGWAHSTCKLKHDREKHIIIKPLPEFRRRRKAIINYHHTKIRESLNKPC